MDSLKELRAKVKQLRESVSKPLTKATVDDLKAEIAHHESAMKAAAKREMLAAARAAKKAGAVDASAAAPAEKKPRGRKAAAAAEVVSIPKAEFVKEHKTLVKELKEAKPETLKKEAKKQAKELAAIEKPEKGSKKKVSIIPDEAEEPQVLAKYRR